MPILRGQRAPEFPFHHEALQTRRSFDCTGTIDNTHPSVYFVFVNSAELIKRLEDAGFLLVGTRGSHQKYRHPDGRMTIVPHPKKDLGKGLVQKILRKDAKLMD
jgi:predicted RNA binding protein YcfA (HicA-like mRNA interferase family)